MSTLSLARVRALMAKESAELRYSPGVLIGPVAMLLTAVLMPVAIAVWLPAWSGESLDAAGDVVGLAREFTGPGGAGLTDAALVQVLLFHHFLPLVALVPVVGAMTLITTAVVGEKHARTLEPLLATPLTSAELLLAKTATALAVALASLVAGYVLLLGLVAALALPGVAATLLSARALVLVTGVAPAASLVALTLGAIVSTRARDARSAQQTGVVVVLPLVAGFVAQLNGMVAITTADLAAVTLGLLVLATALAVVAVRAFDRERILTQWT